MQNALEKWMHSEKCSHTELSERMDTHLATVYRILSGSMHKVKVSTLIRLHTATSLSYKKLIEIAEQHERMEKNGNNANNRRHA